MGAKGAEIDVNLDVGAVGVVAPSYKGQGSENDIHQRPNTY